MAKDDFQVPSNVLLVSVHEGRRDPAFSGIWSTAGLDFACFREVVLEIRTGC